MPAADVEVVWEHAGNWAIVQLAQSVACEDDTCRAAQDGGAALRPRPPQAVSTFVDTLGSSAELRRSEVSQATHLRRETADGAMYAVGS